MYATSGSDHYRSQAATTASPAQLVLMLYDGALVAIHRAQVALEQEPLDHERANDQLHRAQAIVMELSVTLDHDRGGELAGNLSSLYAFCQERLIDANVRKAGAPLAAAVDTLTGLRDAWEQACVHGSAHAAAG